MIEKDFCGIFNIICDECDETVDIDTDGDWHKMLHEIKDLGWLYFKINDEYFHFCCEDHEEKYKKRRHNVK